ncbi:hypothetical protein DFP73DRAFT_483082 [Morchella snyderi]|nr:hypothetical protein DFP73DRAFT_483082 [Morchella snyderi]
MASAETCPLNAPHPPQEGSVQAFQALLPTIKSSLITLRHKHSKHSPDYFAAVEGVSDADLTAFGAEDLVCVRVGTSAYGIHIFGKVQLPKTQGGYIHIRMFVGGGEGEKTYKLHCIYTEEKEAEDGRKSFRAIMGEGDELEWFNE